MSFTHVSCAPKCPLSMQQAAPGGNLLHVGDGQQSSARAPVVENPLVTPSLSTLMLVCKLPWDCTRFIPMLLVRMNRILADVAAAYTPLIVPCSGKGKCRLFLETQGFILHYSVASSTGHP
jgi:hypothetical protein